MAWNCSQHLSDEQVLHALNVWVEEFEPDIFALTEAMDHADALPRLRGYRALQEKPPPHPLRGNDIGDCALLVRDDHDVSSSPVSKMTRKWLFPKYDVVHQPHRYQIGNLRVRGRKWRVKVSHWPTGGFDGPNRAAVEESAQKAKKWLLLGLLIPSVDLGDFNEVKAVLQAWFKKVCRVFGKHIDVALTRNVVDCVWEELPKRGSDHYGRHYRFTAKGRG